MRGALPALLLLLCSPALRPGTGYVMEELSGCIYNGSQPGDTSYGNLFFFNRQLVLLFSASDDMFLPCRYCIPEMYEAAKQACIVLNTNPETTDHVKREARRCQQEATMFWNQTVSRREKPSVEVFLPVKVHTESLPVLVCHVSGFYPSDINVAWFRNDILIRNYTQAVRAGDWTYQIVATLDLRDSHPEDNFTCLVDHSSLEMPLTKNWEYGLTSAQIVKISVASVVIVIGLAMLITGILCWKSSKRSGYTPIPGYDEAN